MSSTINTVRSYIYPVAEVVCSMGSAFRATAAIFSHVPGSILRISILSRTLILSNLSMHSIDFAISVKRLRKSKERFINVINTVRLSAVISEDIALSFIALHKVGLLSAKVATIASYVSFGAMVVQAISIGVDVFRITQIVSEIKRVKKGKLDFDRNISFKALYSKKASELSSKENNVDFRRHLKKRLRMNLSLRAIDITVSFVAIIAIGILVFAPSPLAPLAWSLIVIVALASIGLTVTKEVGNRVLEREFIHLKNKKSEDTEYFFDNEPIIIKDIEEVFK